MYEDEDEEVLPKDKRPAAVIHLEQAIKFLIGKGYKVEKVLGFACFEKDGVHYRVRTILEAKEKLNLL